MSSKINSTSGFEILNSNKERTEEFLRSKLTASENRSGYYKCPDCNKNSLWIGGNNAWQCQSGRCHESAQGDLIGLIRLVDAKEGTRLFDEAVAYVGGGSHRSVPSKPQKPKTVYADQHSAIEAARRLAGAIYPTFYKSWKYERTDGSLYAVVMRFHGDIDPAKGRPHKMCTQISQHGDGWILGLPSEKRPLLISDSGVGEILLVEGETSFDAAVELGLNVATYLGGGSGISQADFAPLNGRAVVIAPDKDPVEIDDKGKLLDPTLTSVEKIVRQSFTPESLCVIEIEGLPAKGDLVDLVAQSGVESISAIASARRVDALEWTAVRKVLNRNRPKAVATKDGKNSFMETMLMHGMTDRKPPKQLIDGYLERSQVQLCGFMGSGKGCVGTLMAAHITTGKEWWTGQACDPGSVVIFSAEDTTAVLEYRCRVAGANVFYGAFGLPPQQSVICIGADSELIRDDDGTPKDVMSPAYLSDLKANVSDLTLVVIDPVKNFVGGRIKSESEEDHIRRKLTPVLQWASKNQVCVMLVIQPAKGSRSRHVDEMASGSLAWSAVTRSNVNLERNPNYGPTARVLLAGRQSNSGDGLPVVFDLELAQAIDRDGNLVVDDHGKPVNMPLLKFRETITLDEYVLPPDDRRRPDDAPARPRISDDEVRTAACQLIAASNGGEMQGMPDRAYQRELGDWRTDDRWLHFVCGSLARQFQRSPITIYKIAIKAFSMKDKIPVEGYLTSLVKTGSGDDIKWVWRAISVHKSIEN